MKLSAMIVQTRSKPGRRDALYEAWQRHLREPTEADASRTAYLYCFDDEDPDAYMLVEVFAEGAAPPSPDAPFFQAFMREAGPLLAGSTVRRGEVVWSKGLAS